jgi:hypothetical protein
MSQAYPSNLIHEPFEAMQGDKIGVILKRWGRDARNH